MDVSCLWGFDHCPGIRAFVVAPRSPNDPRGGISSAYLVSALATAQRAGLEGS